MPRKRNAKKRTGTSIIYGRKPAEDCLRAQRRRIHRVHLLQNSPFRLSNSAILTAFSDRRRLDALAGTSHHQGIVLEVDPYPYVDFASVLAGQNEPGLILLLDLIQDPQNVGAILRAAYGFGAGAVILPRDRSAWITPAVVKASAGASEHLRICLVTNLARAMEELKTKDYWIYGASLAARETLSAMKPSARTALVVGNEESGLRRLTEEKCDFLFRIPLKTGLDSLNVSQATSIALYHFTVSNDLPHRNPHRGRHPARPGAIP